MKATKKQKKQEDVLLTPHQAMAAELGIHANYLSVLQRQEAVPAKVQAFTKADEQFILKMRKVVGDNELIRIQMSQFTSTDRIQIVDESADFFSFKRWEMRALLLYTRAYTELAKISNVPTRESIWAKVKAPETAETNKKAVRIRRTAMVLARKTPAARRRKGQNVAPAKGPAFEKWELRAIHFYVALYREVKQIDTVDVSQHLYQRYKVQNTPGNRARVQQIRRIAAERVRAAGEEYTNSEYAFD